MDSVGGVVGCSEGVGAEDDPVLELTALRGLNSEGETGPTLVRLGEGGDSEGACRFGVGVGEGARTTGTPADGYSQIGRWVPWAEPGP